MKTRLITLQFAKKKNLPLKNVESVKIYNYGLQPANFTVNNFERELPSLANYPQTLPYELKSNYPFDLEIEINPADGIVLVEYFKIADENC